MSQRTLRAGVVDAPGASGVVATRAITAADMIIMWARWIYGRFYWLLKNYVVLQVHSAGGSQKASIYLCARCSHKWMLRNETDAQLSMA